MKKGIIYSIIMLIVIFAVSCNQAQTEQKQETKQEPEKTQIQQSAKLQVLYFHATNRCATCNAVEDNAKKLLQEQYKTQIDNGTIKFASYNFEEEANKTLVEKYQIGFSTLLLVKADDTFTDFTDNAFQYARSNPEKYAELLKTEIEKNLK